MASQASNNIKNLLATAAIDFSSDVFKLVLMDNSFTFDKDTHDEYSDISGDEHANGTTGYATGGATLAGVSVTRDDGTDVTSVTWNDVVWTSAGTGLSSVGACIIDDTATNDPVVGFIDFGGLQTIAVGGALTVANITVEVA